MSTLSFQRNRMSMLGRMMRVSWFVSGLLFAAVLFVGCPSKGVWIDEIDVMQEAL